MRIIIPTTPQDMPVITDPTLGRRTIMLDTGSGRIWKISTAFEGRGIHVTNAMESSCDVMQMFPLSRHAVQLVQYATRETEPYEERIRELEEELEAVKAELKTIATASKRR